MRIRMKAKGSVRIIGGLLVCAAAGAWREGESVCVLFPEGRHAGGRTGFGAVSPILVLRLKCL